jgi:HK97 family phage prohead protease
MENKSLPMLDIRAAFRAESVNEEARTVEVIFGTDTPVRMWNWDIGDFMEEMSFENGHVRWQRLNSGAPVLDNHDSDKGTEGVIGVVERAWAEDGKGYAEIRFSKQKEGDRAFQEVKDGILKGVSFGYRVYKYEQQTTEEGQLPRLRAVDWEPFEISLAPIQADPNAVVRKNSEELNKVQILGVTLPHNRNSNDTGMTDPTTNPTPAAEPVVAAAPVVEPTASVDPVAVAADERKRIKTINDLARKFNVEPSVVDSLIDTGVSEDKARKTIMDNWTANDPAANVRGNAPAVKADERDKYRAAAIEGIVLRVNPNHEAKVGGDEFRGMTIVDLAKDVLERSGEATRGKSRREVLSMALRQHTISDFPIILGNTINRQLQAAYQRADQTYAPFCRRTSIADMRPKTVAKLSGLMGTLQAIPEGGEYTATTVTEDKETYSLVKYGRKIGLTLEAMLNDDLDAFSRLPQAIAQAARNFESNTVYGILTGTPLMNDGFALFSSQHGNLGTAGAISNTTLAEAKKLMRQQTGLEGDFLNVMLKYLIVGPDNEQEALQWMNASFSPATVGNTNIYQGSMQVIVEPRITTKNWFAAAEPTAIDTIEYAYLEGENGLYTEQKEGFDIDGIEIKARLFFAAKAIDHRGLFKNPYV